MRERCLFSESTFSLLFGLRTPSHELPIFSASLPSDTGRDLVFHSSSKSHQIDKINHHSYNLLKNKVSKELSISLLKVSLCGGLSPSAPDKVSHSPSWTGTGYITKAGLGSLICLPLLSSAGNTGMHRVPSFLFLPTHSQNQSQSDTFRRAYFRQNDFPYILILILVVSNLRARALRSG